MFLSSICTSVSLLLLLTACLPAPQQVRGRKSSICGTRNLLVEVVPSGVAIPLRSDVRSAAAFAIDLRQPCRSGLQPDETAFRHEPLSTAGQSATASCSTHRRAGLRRPGQDFRHRWATLGLRTPA